MLFRITTKEVKVLNDRDYNSGNILVEKPEDFEGKNPVKFLMKYYFPISFNFIKLYRFEGIY